MFKHKSKVLFISAILGTLYLVYLLSHFGGATVNNNGIEQAGATIATLIILPHFLLLLLATIFNWLAFSLVYKGFAITSGVLYSVSGAVFFLYLIFVVPMIVLSFVGVMSISKIKANTQESINN